MYDALHTGIDEHTTVVENNNNKSYTLGLEPL